MTRPPVTDAPNLALSSPSPDRRRLLGLAAGGLIVSALPRAAAAREGSLVDFGADNSGKADCTDALTRAIAQLDVVNIPPGNFLVGDVKLRAGVTLRGQGENCVLRHKAGAHYALRCDSGSADSVIRNITLQNFKMRGNCDSAGFSEHLHLLSLNGVADVKIDGMFFVAFQGDGIYLGSSDSAHAERHNRNITISNCVFDGVNSENRNAISAIDVDSLVIEQCKFLRVSRKDMPGAIDLEPNGETFHVIRNVRIQGNLFSDVGGGIGGVCMFIPRAVGMPPVNIIVTDNTMQHKGPAAFAFNQANGAPTSGQGIVVRNNHVGGQWTRPFDVRGVNGVEFGNNNFTDCTQAALVGWREPSTAVTDLWLHDNQFERCGNVGGVGITVFSVSTMRVENNQFTDCGNGQPSAFVFDFNAGQSNHVSFRHNQFASPGGRTRGIVQKEAAHHFDGGSNVFAGDNIVPQGLANRFEANGR